MQMVSARYAGRTQPTGITACAETIAVRDDPFMAQGVARATDLSEASGLRANHLSDSRISWRARPEEGEAGVGQVLRAGFDLPTSC